MLIILALTMAIVYGIVGFLQARAKSGAIWNWGQFIATLVYSVAVGLIAVLTGALTLTNVDMSIIATVWAAYIGYLTMAQTLLDALIAYLFKKPAGLAHIFT
jgi:hypothetical protein